jgi:hypothetical protein
MALCARRLSNLIGCGAENPNLVEIDCGSGDGPKLTRSQRGCVACGRDERVADEYGTGVGRIGEDAGRAALMP